ncbi:MAG TPA: DUF1801 domain-containing protein [Steroidobacteraceae bacterium]|nr:DUF1801 domain-containing protein [Steroidobacteraceae bacterium]
MAENKTRPGRAGVEGFIAKIKDPERRKDCDTLVKMMRKATGARPVMWGSIVGFGDFHYLYESGREGDWFQMGFANRKPDLVLYVMDGLEPYEALLARLGRHRTGKCCLYIRRLADVHVGVLERILAISARRISKRRDKPCS